MALATAKRNGPANEARSAGREAHEGRLEASDQKTKLSRQVRPLQHQQILSLHARPHQCKFF